MSLIQMYSLVLSIKSYQNKAIIVNILTFSKNVFYQKIIFLSVYIYNYVVIGTLYMY